MIAMERFEDLVESRKAWLRDVLQAWCRTASLTALRRAELEWVDLAGKVAPEKTLWPWAWSRFPELVHESLGIDETNAVEVTLQDGMRICGFPDSRASVQGQLVLWAASSDGTPGNLGPYSIETIRSVRRLTAEELSALEA